MKLTVAVLLCMHILTYDVILRERYEKYVERSRTCRN